MFNNNNNHLYYFNSWVTTNNISYTLIQYNVFYIKWKINIIYYFLFDNKITSNQNAKWLLKETFRPFTNDKVNCYYFVSTNCLKYNKTDQDKCVECHNITLLKKN